MAYNVNNNNNAGIAHTILFLMYRLYIPNILSPASYSHTSCQNGYSAGYDYKLKGTDNAIVQKYRESTAYKQGFEAGAKNLDETGACLTKIAAESF
ncbi:MAG: hypothetical protein WA323_09175 [Candidatus Nitrosopolaris sp.]